MQQVKKSQTQTQVDAFQPCGSTGELHWDAYRKSPNISIGLKVLNLLAFILYCSAFNHFFYVGTVSVGTFTQKVLYY